MQNAFLIEIKLDIDFSQYITQLKMHYTDFSSIGIVISGKTISMYDSVSLDRFIINTLKYVCMPYVFLRRIERFEISFFFLTCNLVYNVKSVKSCHFYAETF